MAFNDQLSQELKKIIQELYGISLEEEINFTAPPQPEMGDLAFPCFALAKKIGKPPVEIAQDLAKRLLKAKSIEKAEAAGPYLNFCLARQEILSQLYKKILKKKISFAPKGKKKKIMVEYLSPNINKPLHLGHLRNGALGMAISCLLSQQKNKVWRANLVNDRGVHICKAILAWEKWGKGSTPQKEKKKPDHWAGDWYVRFEKEAQKDESLREEAQKMLVAWEKGDKKVRGLWQKMRKWVLAGFAETYTNFHFLFDVFFFESDIYKLGKKLVKKGLEKKIFTYDEKGAVVFLLPPEKFGREKDGSQKKVTLLRPDGTSVYLTQDLGLVHLKMKKYKLDKSIYVVGSEQNYYLQCLFTICEALGLVSSGSCYHLSYSMVYLPEGKMKSREGKVVDADDLLAEVSDLALQGIRSRYSTKELPEKEARRRAKIIARNAIKFYLLRVNPQQSIYFNPQESLSLDGFTSLFCQYAYARASNILAKAKLKEDSLQRHLSFHCLQGKEEAALLQKIIFFEEKVSRAAQEFNPSLLAVYVFELAKLFNKFYQNVPVLGEKNSSVRKARLALVQMSASVLKQGLALLDIEVLKKI